MTHHRVPLDAVVPEVLLQKIPDFWLGWYAQAYVVRVRVSGLARNGL